ncbi:hypothetical protein CCR95_06030 [Thiocystis minor]|uniref:hypothetical protein n=1 Tax=Thiocystis minor TaxID=61597 RepID=UPI0019125E23|nr:hypothetical protein [Thiocystis minor]MBK5963654.1 hypothetical protein [Thiocystis minor]
MTSSPKDGAVHAAPIVAIPAELFKGKNRALAAELITIVGDLREYWPLTVRQTYYQAVSRLLVQNHQNEYRKVSRLLTTLRRHDLLPWHAIEDRTRTTFGKRGRPNVGEYIQGQIESFLDPYGYGRCYIQDQPVYVEVATEKDALSSIMSEAVWYFCTRLNIVRGQVSATMVNAMAERFDRAVMLGKRPILIYLGDLDPSGIAIPKALQRNMADWHSVEVELIRVALNPDQISKYRLPLSPDAAKESDPNYQAWLAEYGDQRPVELDALHPRDLTQITKDALSAVYDMTSVDAHKAKEAEERDLLRQMKHRVEDFIAGEWPEVFHAA